MNLTVKDCYWLSNDFQNQFISREVKPEPEYIKLKLAERTIHKIHYKDVFILEPKQYYKIAFEEDISDAKTFEFEFICFAGTEERSILCGIRTRI